MKIAVTVLTFLIGFLSIAAGIAKVMLVPDEVLFLAGFGFTEPMVIIYGGLQVFGGILFVVPFSSVVGAAVVILAFSLSTLLLFLGGDIVFAIVSVLPILLAGFVVFNKLRVKPQVDEADA